MSPALRVMLVDESESRSLELSLMLAKLGYEVVAEVSNPRELYAKVRELAPDVIIIDTESPSRDTLEHVALLSERDPRPIVMFSADRTSETIRAATGAGVSAYIVDGLSASRVEPIIAAAVARFDAFQKMRHELARAQTQLSDRKLVERAKGVIMRQKGIDEAEAYALMRRQAMHKSVRLVDIANTINEAERMLNG